MARALSHMLLTAVGLAVAVSGITAQVPTAAQAPLTRRSVTTSTTPTSPTTAEIYGKLPLVFEDNGGRYAAGDFVSRGSGYSIALTPTGNVLALQRSADGAASAPAVLRSTLVGASFDARSAPSAALPGTVNSFVGRDPAGWKTGIATYSRVGYRDVYPGIDVVYYGNQRQLEYDFVVAAGADPSAIGFAFDGAGAIAIESGDLVLRLGDGEVRHKAPLAYQEIDGARRSVAARYAIDPSGVVRFHLGGYRTDLPLVIDPVLAYSTYLGGSAADVGLGIAADGSGAVYISGHTNSTDFPLANAYQNTNKGGTYGDAFVLKLNAAGSGLVYSTYFGGTGEDNGRAIAIDGSGNAYVVGDTASTDFPLQNAAQSTYGGIRDGFVARFNASGQLTFSTYLGGVGSYNVGLGVAVDGSGNAYVTGRSDGGLPVTTGVLQNANAGGADAFVAKFDASGVVQYCTYLGGTGDDYGRGIAVDSSGNSYVVGDTNNGSFPTTVGSFQPTFGGWIDAFVVKVNATGSAKTYSTFLGGSDSDSGAGIALDTSGNVYVTGTTSSANFPLKNALYSTLKGQDVFVTEIDVSGGSLVYSTLFGGSETDRGMAIKVNSAGTAYVAGTTMSSDLPLFGPSTQTTFGGYVDGFVALFAPMGSSVTFSTYYGGTQLENLNAMAIDSGAGVYITGETGSSDLPLKRAMQPTFQGSDAFAAKIAVVAPALQVTKIGTPDPVGPGGTVTYTITVLNNSTFPANGVTLDDTLPNGTTFVSATPSGTGTCVNTATTLDCGWKLLGSFASETVTLVVTAPSTTGTLLNTATANSNEGVYYPSAAMGTSTINVAETADLAPFNTGTPSPIASGRTLSYTIGAINNGPGTATNVTITNEVLDGMTMVSAPGCSLSGSIASCFVGTLATGAFSQGFLITVTYPIVSGPPPLAQIRNKTTVSGTAIDPDPTNNSFTVTTLVYPLTDLSLTKTGPTSAVAGDLVTFTITVTNGGPSNATKVLVYDPLPAGTTFASISSPQTSICGQETGGPHVGEYGCNFASLAAGASGTITFSVYATGTSALSNTATAYAGLNPIESIDVDPDPSNDSATRGVQVLPNTPAGPNIVTQPRDRRTGTQPMTITFANVSVAGITTLTTSGSGPTPPPGFTGFQLGNTYYELHTTATYSGNVRVCVTDTVNVTTSSRFFHYETNPLPPPPPMIFVDRTVMPVQPPTICADVTSFSLFAIFADVTAPTITIALPAAATYQLGQSVLADYTCTDAGTGIASCAGTVTKGHAVDTASVGTKAFIVDATDRAGNAAHQSVTYTVTYRICDIGKDNTNNSRNGADREDQGGSTKLRIRLCTAAGVNVSSSAVKVNAVSLDGAPLPASAETAFSFDAGLRGYVLKVKGLDTGVHTIRISVSGDPVPHDLRIGGTDQGGDGKNGA